MRLSRILILNKYLSCLRIKTIRNKSDEKQVMLFENDKRKNEEKVSQNLFLSGSIYDDPIESKSVV